jgi:hypothetical protein
MLKNPAKLANAIQRGSKASTVVAFFLAFSSSGNP